MQELSALFKRNPELADLNADLAGVQQRTPAQPSTGENKFADIWQWLDGPELEREYRFDPERRWRADFAHPESRTLIEIEGGTWGYGRHNRAQGYAADCEKYNAAQLAGWTVFRLTTEMVDVRNVETILDYVQREWKPDY